MVNSLAILLLFASSSLQSAIQPLPRQQDQDASSTIHSINIPTETPAVESLTLDIFDSQIDKDFAWPDTSEDSGPANSLACKNCTITGQLILTQGEVEMTDWVGELTEQILNEDEELDLIKSGFFQLELNGFESSHLLKAVVSHELEVTVELFTTSVKGFKIANLGVAGLSFQPQLVFTVNTDVPVELEWGFSVKIPSKSTIRLDIGEFSESKLTGFDAVTISALPFNTNVSDATISIQTELRSYLPLGISFLDERIVLQGGPYLSLPSISTTISQLSTDTVNENCEPGTNPQTEAFRSAYPNLTHVVSEVGMKAGFEFNAVFKTAVDLPDVDLPFLPPIDLPDINVPFREFTKTYVHEMVSPTLQALPTACLAFKRETGMVQAAVEAEVINAPLETPTDAQADVPPDAQKAQPPKEGAGTVLSSPFSATSVAGSVLVGMWVMAIGLVL
ncbi:hypothetical protein M011DRAFT_478261 [Sporormia fimetaria CBS 119925]|uniref:GPI anchored protein n=1 Tax=Sporormia fimetaria CBS 119925 TaxID=1340428 RepID=A0A6A6VAV0_9PLEO|nr:hypothetical protein M011DRAFT_478261 [Sporormia fimetaria CBS 119925]